MSQFAQIDVKEVRTDVPRAQFAEALIEDLADQILASGGVLRPLIVKQVDIDRYMLLDGAFEYYGAIRAREKDPRQGELVNAFVITPKTEAAAQRQLTLMADQTAATAGPPPPSVSVPGTNAASTPATGELAAFINNFVTGSEARLSEMREQLFQAKREWEGRLAKLESALAAKKQQDLLEVINSLPEGELIARLTFHGLDKAKAQAIAEARQSKAQGRFESYLDLLGTKGLGDKGLVRLIDHWQQLQKL